METDESSVEMNKVALVSRVHNQILIELISHRASVGQHNDSDLRAVKSKDGILHSLPFSVYSPDSRLDLHTDKSV